MERTTLAFVLATALGPSLAVTSCDSSATNNVFPDLAFSFDLATPSMDLSVSPDLTQPPPPPRPLLGMQLDRVGRPAINNALSDPFGQNQMQTTDQLKNQYNAAGFANWNMFAPAPYLAANLAIYDGLDGTCGNQFLAGATANATRYQTLSTMLADDRLYVNATTGTCVNYLAVERQLAGDCGGRHPIMKVMDLTYNLLITGNAAGTYTSGPTADSDGPPSAAFPFLQPPS